MKPIKFKEMTSIYAKDQKEYLPLPTHIASDGVITSCWKLTMIERLKLLFTGRVYCQIMCFHKALPPQKLSTKFEVYGG